MAPHPNPISQQPKGYQSCYGIVCIMSQAPPPLFHLHFHCSHFSGVPLAEEGGGGVVGNPKGFYNEVSIVDRFYAFVELNKIHLLQVHWLGRSSASVCVCEREREREREGGREFTATGRKPYNAFLVIESCNVRLSLSIFFPPFYTLLKLFLYCQCFFPV